ncbi:hypothetical protein H7I76_19190 [Mycolicibacterium vaccae]|nr:hypothetical protein [Mycolicibacterium vaccae]
MALSCRDRKHHTLVVRNSLGRTPSAAHSKPSAVDYLGPGSLCVGLAEVGEGSSLVQRIVRWIESSTFRAADHVVVIHERFNALVTQELGVAADRVSVIRNWTHLADPPNTTAVQARRQLGWPADVILAVHTGNMGRNRD